MTVIALIICVLGVVAAEDSGANDSGSGGTHDLYPHHLARRHPTGRRKRDIDRAGRTPEQRSLAATDRLNRFIWTAPIELEFPFGINLNDTLIKVSNALSQVPSYPNNVNEPRVYATSFSANSFMYFRVMPLDGNPRNLNMVPLQDFIEDNVASRMETVPGVSEVSTYGGAERQIQILIDPAKLVRGTSLSLK